MNTDLETRLPGRPLLQRVIGNTAWQVADKVLRLGAGLLVSIWVARYLGPDRFGLLNYAIALVALFGCLADGGMQSVIVRELVERSGQRAQIVASALALRVMGALVAVSLTMLAAQYLRPNDPLSRTMIFVISLSLLAQAWDVIDYEHQARLDAQPVVLARAVSFFVFSSLKIVLIILGAPITAFAWLVTGEAVLSAVIFRLLPNARSTLDGKGKASWREVAYLIRTCWPLAVAGLSVMLYMRIDQVMLGQMLDDRFVGTFSAAVRISESWYFLPIAVLSSVSPALTLTMKDSQERYVEKLRRVTKMLCWLSIAMALVVSMASKPIIHILYGNAYADASRVLVVHAWAGVCVSLGLAGGPWFVNGNLLKLRMLQTIGGALINVLLNLYAIPRHGIVGAAWATLISQACSAVVFNAFSARTRPVLGIQLRAIFLR
jgi:PST family polysaccharide transporter